MTGDSSPWLIRVGSCSEGDDHRASSFVFYCLSSCCLCYLSHDYLCLRLFLPVLSSLWRLLVVNANRIKVIVLAFHTCQHPDQSVLRNLPLRVLPVARWKLQASGMLMMLTLSYSMWCLWYVCILFLVVFLHRSYPPPQHLEC